MALGTANQTLNDLASDIRLPLLRATTENQYNSNYNPLLFPPDVEKAKLHGISTRVSKPCDPFKEVPCECCQRNIAPQPLPLLCKLQDLYPFRFCTPLYFSMVKFCVKIVIIMLIISSIYSMSSNYNGSYSGATHSRYLANRLSALQVLSNEDDILVQTLLGFIALSVFLLLFQRFQDEQRKIIYDCHERVISPSDYAIRIRRLQDVYVTDIDIRDYLLVNGLIEDFSSLKKVIFTYDIKELTQLHRKRAKLIRIRNKLQELSETGNTNQQENHTNASKIQQIDTELKQIEVKLTEIEEKCTSDPTTFKFSGTAIVVLDNQADVKRLKRKWKMSWFSWLIVRILSRFEFFTTYKLKNRLIDVRPVPDPVDILWENVGSTRGWKIFRIMRINLITVVVIFIGAAIEFGMSYLNHYEARSGQSHTLLSWLTSLVVVAVNATLIFIIRKAATAERHISYTSYHQSVAEKLIYSQFINTAIIPVAVNFAVFMVAPQSSLEILDGLAYDMFFVFLSNAIVTPLTLVFDPWYMLKLYKQKKLQKDPKYGFMTQAEANALFEGPQFDIASSYASIIKTMWLTAFYAPLIPVCIPISVVGVVFKYWVDKYLFLRRYTAPKLMGKNLAKVMVKYLEVVPFALAVGIFLINIFAEPADEAFNFSLLLSFAGLVTSLFYIIAPIRKVYKKLSKKSGRDLTKTLSYDLVRFKFPTDYDRANPVTQAAAEEEYLATYIETLGDNNTKKNLQDSLAKLKQLHRTQGRFGKTFQNYVLDKGDLEETCDTFVYAGEMMPSKQMDCSILMTKDQENHGNDFPIIYSQMLQSPSNTHITLEQAENQHKVHNYTNPGYALANQGTTWYPSF